MNNDLVMAKLIKLYIMKHPLCTSKQISTFFAENEFGIKKQYTSVNISSLIKECINASSGMYAWFNVEIIKTKGKVQKYRVVS